MKAIDLYYRKGTSDKEYHAQIKPRESGYMVLYWYGRRGNPLTSGIKTSTPVPLEDAQKILNRLIKEKMAKGYKAGEESVSYVGVETQNQFTGIGCQLLNPIETEQISAFINSDQFCLQEKEDGRRLLIKLEDGVVTGINRKGLSVAVSKSIEEDVRKLGTQFILDGEVVGETYVAFDLLEIGGINVRGEPYEERWEMLLNRVEDEGRNGSIELVKTAFGFKDKQALFHKLWETNREGVVFKDLFAPYTEGRPCSGGSQLKYKFYDTASALVRNLNDKRSVGLCLIKNGQWVDAGNVTIPPNESIPEIGSVVEIRYLYAFPESGRFYQPTYLGVRDDIDPKECTVKQLKYKSSDDEGGEV